MKKEKSLIRKGILDLKPYFPGKPIEEVKRELGLKEVIKLASPAYETAAKIVFLCNPNNPTGTIVDKEAVDRFIKQVPEDVVVVFDEAYYDYVEDEDYPNSLSYVLEEKNIIVLRTFSKIAGIAGVRIGTPYENEKFIQALKKIMSS
jgi:histidinol-phosphate/aromatic aminotransferase/cobyric acid decarboxylase-like protein